jgi:eukaryotic translation initiation factor 2C
MISTCVLMLAWLYVLSTFRFDCNALFLNLSHVTWAFQGTTRPTHYHVLHDDIGFSPDDLQELVHNLSYVYVYWSSYKRFSCSLPPLVIAASVLTFQCLRFRYQRSTTAISIGKQDLPLPDFARYDSRVLLITWFSLSVAPIYYAHHAAAQVAKFTRLDDMSETSSSHASQAEPAPVPELPRLHPDVASSMFFC